MSALTAGCANATRCIDRVPQAQRADLVRFVLERGMLRETEVPVSDLDLARLYGRDPETLSDEQVRDLSPRALGYAHCVRSTTRLD